MTRVDDHPMYAEEEPAGGRQRAVLPRNVRLLGWASCLNDVASEMIYPLLPQFLIGVLGGDRFLLGLIEGVADSLTSLLKVVVGSWSDRMRRRRVWVVSGYMLAGLSRPWLALVTAPWQLFALRVLDRLGKGIRTAPRDAMIADSTPQHERGRAFGFHRAMDHLGAAIGPVLATLFLWWWPDGVRPLFALSVVPGMLVVGLLTFGLREPRHGASAARDRSQSDAPRAAAARELPVADCAAQPPGFRWLLLGFVIFTLGNSSDTFLLLRAAEAGVPVVWTPLLWFGFHLAKSLGTGYLGRWVDQFGPRVLLAAGWLCYVAAYLSFGMAHSAAAILGAFLVYAIYYGLAEPAEKTLIANTAAAGSLGRAFGWYNFAIGFAALPANLIFGAIYQQWGPSAAFLWGALLAGAALVVFLAATRPAVATGH